MNWFSKLNISTFFSVSILITGTLFFAICYLERQKSKNDLIKELNVIYDYDIDSALKIRLMEKTIRVFSCPTKLPSDLLEIHNLPDMPYNVKEKIRLIETELCKENSQIFSFSCFGLIFTCSTTLISACLGEMVSDTFIAASITYSVALMIFILILTDFLEKKARNRFILSVVENMESDL